MDLEDLRKEKFVPDDAYWRLQSLFPTCKAVVLKHLIKVKWWMVKKKKVIGRKVEEVVVVVVLEKGVAIIIM